MLKYLRVIAVFLFVVFVLSAAGQSPKISTVEDIERDVKLVPCKSEERLEAVQKVFRAMGASDADITVDDKKGTKNVVVTKKGTTPETIIVGAHYDKVDDGCGAID